MCPAKDTTRSLVVSRYCSHMVRSLAFFERLMKSIRLSLKNCLCNVRFELRWTIYELSSALRKFDMKEGSDYHRFGNKTTTQRSLQQTPQTSLQAHYNHDPNLQRYQDISSLIIIPLANDISSIPSIRTCSIQCWVQSKLEKHVSSLGSNTLQPSGLKN